MRFYTFHTRGWHSGIKVISRPEGETDCFDVYVTSGSQGGAADRLVGRLSGEKWRNETQEQVPPRKRVMAWNVEPFEENGDEFFVLTFHHGLGYQTRLDLSAEELRDLAGALLAQVTCAQSPRLPDAHGRPRSSLLRGAAVVAAVTLSDPVSLDDIARRLGVKPQTPRQWRQRGVMPAPLFVVARVPVWDWPAIEAWARETNRWRPLAETAPADTAGNGNQDAADVLLRGGW